MERTTLKVSEIKNNPNNPRLIKDDKFKKLVQSIKDFPEMLETREIVVNKDHVILGGNMRFKAAKEAGLKEIPVKIVDWDEDRQREFIIKDNVSGGEWDWDLLANEWDAGELDDWGLDLPADWAEETEIVEDEAPEVSDEPPVSKLGEIYQLGRHRVMCADSTVRENVELLMNGEKADMVFTDPPYGMNFQSNFREKTPQFDKLLNDDVVLDVAPVLHHFMKDDSVAYICTRWDLYPQWYMQIEKLFDIKNCVVWYKKGGGLGDLANSYLPNHEFIITAHKGTGKLRGKRDADVWQIGRDGFNDYAHPTQKPVELSAFAIEHHSDKGDSVLDLFLGSGSTLIACEQTDRTCYGMELDPKYVDVIRKRYHKFVTGSEEGWEDGTPAI